MGDRKHSKGTAAASGAGAGGTGGGNAEAGIAQTFGQAFGAAQGMGIGTSQAPPNVQPVQFANLQGAGAPGEQGNIGLLMDVYMELTVELGRTRKLIREILGIGEGTTRLKPRPGSSFTTQLRFVSSSSTCSLLKKGPTNFVGFNMEGSF